MPITTPLPITLLPTPPTTADPANFDARMDSTLEAMQGLVPEVNAATAATYSNAVQAEAAAVVATSNATESSVSAAASLVAAQAAGVSQAQSAGNYLDFDRRYLGRKATPPTLDNQGAALVLGALYFQDAVGMRAWNGSAWEAAFLPASGYQELLISNFNIKTVGGSTLLGSGNIPTRQPNSDISQHTASGTFVVPDGVYVLRPYAFGAGADGTTTNGGGGGGCAYGDISVAPGQSVAVSIVSGVAKVSIAGVDLLTANPASGTTGGTASKHASVANGGAYAGGAGTGLSGGGASGSPLGVGGSMTSAPSGGAAWGRGSSSIAGEGIGSAALAYAGGGGLAVPSMDPLLKGLNGLGGVNAVAANAHGAPGQPGAGGGAGVGTGIGGAGGFGAGSGISGNAASVSAPGGFGGGGAANNIGGGTGGAGGYGGGGGAGGGTGGPGGAAVVRIYY